MRWAWTSLGWVFVPSGHLVTARSQAAWPRAPCGGAVDAAKRRSEVRRFLRLGPRPVGHTAPRGDKCPVGPRCQPARMSPWEPCLPTPQRREGETGRVALATPAHRRPCSGTIGLCPRMKAQVEQACAERTVGRSHQGRARGPHDPPSGKPVTLTPAKGHPGLRASPSRVPCVFVQHSLQSRRAVPEAGPDLVAFVSDSGLTSDSFN